MFGFKALRGLKIVALVALPALLGTLALSAQSGDCSVTLSPGDSIQGAIDGASSGSVICLNPGEYDEALKVSKDLALRGRGSGPEDVVIRWTGDFDHVIQISGSAEVGLENLTLTKAEQFVCLVRVDEIACSSALLVEDRATVTAEEVRLEGAGAGLLAQGSSAVAMRDSEAVKNAFGVFAEGGATITLESTELRENSLGAQARGSAELLFKGGQIRKNDLDGLKVEGDASAVLEGITVEENGLQRCERRRMICNGITVRERAQLTLRDSTVKKNADWGLSAVRGECGYPRDDFEGSVAFEGENVIEENDVFGRQRARGNPGDHPWNGEGVEGGQVCLSEAE